MFLCTNLMKFNRIFHRFKQELYFIGKHIKYWKTLKSECCNSLLYNGQKFQSCSTRKKNLRDMERQRLKAYQKVGTNNVNLRHHFSDETVVQEEEEGVSCSPFLATML